MRFIALISLSLLLSGCNSIPSPSGWESQKTKQDKEHAALVEKLVDKAAEETPPDRCASIAKPSKYSDVAGFALYYMAISNCQSDSSNHVPPSLIALQELEKTKRLSISEKNKSLKTITDTLLGVAQLGVQIDIAKKDRESNERISDAENSPSSGGQGSITVGGDYIVDSEKGTSSDTSTTTSTVDSNDTSTTTTTTNHITEETSNESEEPIISDSHARCIYNSKTEAARISCNIVYQNSERRIVYNKCSANGWARDDEECTSDIADRDTWASRMGLEWNDETMTYEVIERE